MKFNISDIICFKLILEFRILYLWLSKYVLFLFLYFFKFWAQNMIFIWHHVLCMSIFLKGIEKFTYNLCNKFFLITQEFFWSHATKNIKVDHKMLVKYATKIYLYKTRVNTKVKNISIYQINIISSLVFLFLCLFKFTMSLDRL